MATIDVLKADLDALKAQAKRNGNALATRGQFHETRELIERAEANIECVDLFPDVAPQTFLLAAQSLQTRAWLRVNNQL